MPRLARYLGRWIRHSGWYPDRKVRLYHRDRAAWQGDYVHESVQVSGPLRHLETPLLHFTCDSLGQHLRTLDRYTTLYRPVGSGVRESRFPSVAWWWTHRGLSCVRISFNVASSMACSMGFVIAVLAGFYTFMKYAKARELPREKKP